MAKKRFSGDRKAGNFIFQNIEAKFVRWGVPKIPKFIETYHLTYMTILWSVLIIFFGFLAKSSRYWLWLISLVVILQYLTDLFDGAVGRARNTGLVRWGYFMDHLLDYFFLSSIIGAYYLISPPEVKGYFLFLFVILVGFLINTFLNFAAAEEFRVYYFGLGPTEMRLVFILFNTYVAVKGVESFIYIIPALCICASAGLVFIIYHTSKNLWRKDMAEKDEVQKNKLN